MNFQSIDVELRRLIGNENKRYSKQEWMDYVLNEGLVSDIKEAENLFDKFDDNMDGFINVTDIEKHYEMADDRTMKEDIYSTITTDKLMGMKIKTEERILNFFKTIQTQYPALQRYFEDLLIDIINEISEIKVENEKLEQSYNKEKVAAQEKVKLMEDELESWAIKFENEMKIKLAQYEQKIKSISSEKERLQHEIENYKSLKIREKKTHENSGLETALLDNEVFQLQSNLRNVESLNAHCEARLKFLEVQLERKEQELEFERENFKSACYDSQMLEANLVNLVCANRKLNDDNDHLRSALISLSTTVSLKSFNMSPEYTNGIDIDSEISAHKDVNDADNEFTMVTKVERVHSFLKSQAKCYKSNSSSQSYDSDVDEQHTIPISETKISRASIPFREDKIMYPSIFHDTSTRIEPERLFKLVLVGDTAVGKTSFMLRFCKNVFDPSLPSTVGIDYNTKTAMVDGRLVALQMWDTGGQERFRSIVATYFRRADGILLLYDVTNPTSFISVRSWINIIRNADVGENIPIMLIGNKIDFRHSSTSLPGTYVKTKEAHLLAKNYGLLFKEISVKENVNVESAVIDIARKLKAREDLELSRIHLAETGQNKKNTLCCSKI